MKITIAQRGGFIDDPESNYAKMKMVVGNVDSDLFIFPEMFLCGYVKTKDKMHAKMIEERMLPKYKEYAIKRNCAMILGGPQRDGDLIYDAAYFINGNDVQTYRKIHLSNNSIVDEKTIFTAGKGPVCIEYKGLKFGISMGHDLYFPEMFRWYAANDVDMVICIAAATEPVMNDYEKLIAARAVENNMHIVFVNMVGNDSGQMMIGRSRWVSPKGEVLESCTESSDARHIKVNDQEIKDTKKDRFTLKEMRTDVDWKV